VFFSYATVVAVKHGFWVCFFSRFSLKMLPWMLDCVCLKYLKYLYINETNLITKRYGLYIWNCALELYLCFSTTLKSYPTRTTI